MAAKFDIQVILCGWNSRTERILPRRWNYKKFDATNLKAIHARFGDRKLKSFPLLGVKEKFYYTNVKGCSIVSLLELVDYVKADAVEKLTSSFGWRNYGGKHHESVFTRFYQGYILPHKFNIDKRLAHLSTLICNGEMTRDDALVELNEPTYDPQLQERDKVYVAKKLGFSTDEFEAVLSLPNRSHSDFPTDESARKRFQQVQRFLSPVYQFFGGDKRLIE